MMQVPGYKRCPFYEPVCKHILEEGKWQAQHDLLGMCIYWYQEAGTCSNMQNCDMYGYLPMSSEEAIQTKIMIANRVTNH